MPFCCLCDLTRQKRGSKPELGKSRYAPFRDSQLISGAGRRRGVVGDGLVHDIPVLHALTCWVNLASKLLHASPALDCRHWDVFTFCNVNNYSSFSTANELL